MKKTSTHQTRYVAGLLSLALLTVAGAGLTAQRGQNRAQTYAAMSGTYELETTRGGNPEIAARSATRSLPPGQRDRAYQNLLARLLPPHTLIIDRVGNTISLASDRGPRSAFDADGRTHQERGQNGRTVNTHTALLGTTLTVTSNGGGRGSDFSVTFESLNNGANLLVTRRLDDEDLARPVTIQSYYRRTAAPRWDIYGGPGYDQGGGRGGSRSGYGSDAMTGVPDGTRLVATLDTPLSMRNSRHGDAFSMTVREPGQFRGARIDGLVSRVNGYRGNGTGNDMSIDFQSVQIGGRASEFDAVLNTVRLRDGTILRVNADGEVRDMSRGNDAVQNGAIGAAIGAVIGAVAGGGRGAVIGAVIGGAGGVILSLGHEQLDLPAGTEVTLTAVARYRQR